jgi:hypothetical protein
MISLAGLSSQLLAQAQVTLHTVSVVHSTDVLSKASFFNFHPLSTVEGGGVLLEITIPRSANKTITMLLQLQRIRSPTQPANQRHQHKNDVENLQWFKRRSAK